MTRTPDEQDLKADLQRYSEAVRQTRKDPSHSPETSLYTHLQYLLEQLGEVHLGWTDSEIVPQYRTEGVGAPDFAWKTSSGISFVEAKAPTIDIGNLRGPDKQQLERYLRLDNVLYTNFWQLRLYQEGERVGEPVELVPSEWLEPRYSGGYEESLDTSRMIELLHRFQSRSKPQIQTIPHLAVELARATWLVREAVTATADDEGNFPDPLAEIFSEFKEVLFSILDHDRFADAYAQTLAYGVLLARQASDSELTSDRIATYIDATQHRLMKATLTLLTQAPVVEKIGWTVENLVSTVNKVEKSLLLSSGSSDPLLYFYEDFLEEYDPALRKRHGVYFTPPEVVEFQTRVVDHILRKSFGKRYGFAEPTVQTLDPAVGTGTYLLSAFRSGCSRIREGLGDDSVKGAAEDLMSRLYGFEILVGPYTVAHFRLSSALRETGADMTKRLPVYLTDTLEPTLEDPKVPAHFGFMSAPLTEERTLAESVKRDAPVMAILGNPPYLRTKGADRHIWTDLMEDFRAPAREQYAGDFKNLSNFYIWFYRWALWRLFEAPGASETGVLSFISARKWILGGSAGGMRSEFRKHFDRIYILDLHGDSNAPTPADVEVDENVFDITVGVAISVCIADGTRTEEDAEVFYFGERWGGRQSKLKWLQSLEADMSDIDFARVEGTGTDPFYPKLSDDFSDWPRLKDDVFQFFMSGVQTKRDHLVVAPTKEKLRDQIEEFINAPAGRRAHLFHETRDRKAGDAAKTTFQQDRVKKYGYRILDNQYLYDHSDFVEYNRSRSLQKVWGGVNLAFVTRHAGHGAGPVVFLQHNLPDLNSFRRSSYVFPLWDDRGSEQPSMLEARKSNISSKLLARLQAGLDDDGLTTEDVFAYIYCVLSAPSYAVELRTELAREMPRVPFTCDARLFQEAVGIGRRLIAVHSFEESYPADGSLTIVGSADAIDLPHHDTESGRLYVAEETWVEPVSSAAWEFSVSDHAVLSQWLKRREGLSLDISMRTELLDVVWAVERTTGLMGDADDVLLQVLEAETVSRRDL